MGIQNIAGLSDLTGLLVQQHSSTSTTYQNAFLHSHLRLHLQW